ncbi:MAG: ABC transporter ATP-binding protein [Clostridia bacterium]|nr:ABC transporter ATP-binding protein [Clostridia bacterium]
MRLLKLFAPYLRGSRAQCVLAPLFKMSEAVLELLTPLVVARMIDQGIAAGDRNYILKMVGLLALFAAAGLAFSLTAQYFAARASVSFVQRLKSALFDRAVRLPDAQTDAIGVPTLIARMTGDMDTVQNGVNLSLRLLLRSPFVVVGAMIMAFTVDAKAAVTFAVVIPLLSLIVFGILYATIPLYDRIRSALDGVLSTAREGLIGVRVLRAFRVEHRQTEEFKAKNDRLTRLQESTGRISALLNPLTVILIDLAVAVLIYAGAVRVDRGLLTQGAVVALYNYMAQILIELIKFANLVITITKSVACARRIGTVLELPVERQTGSVTNGAGNDAIRFDHVTFAYENAGEATLRDVSFTVRRGETVGIIGATGAGKSTLIDLIPGFYTTDKGEVFVLGENVKDWSPQALRARIAIVPQKSRLVKGTVRSNLLWGDPAATDKALIEALKTAQAYEFVMEKGGLDAPVGQAGSGFSGGQRQRLCIARALVRHADLLILDDSFSALDYVTEAAVRRGIAQTCADTTVVIVSQRTSSILHADRILLMEEGVCTVGTHESLLRSSAVYREIHQTQFEEEATAHA